MALSQPTGLSLSVVPRGDADGYPLVQAAALRLQQSGAFEGVTYPQTIGNDAVVVVTIDMEFKGRGSNFFVSWPGFLVWAPAWAGYGYKSIITTRPDYVDAAGKRLAQSDEWTKEYKFRQSDLGRSWVEISWLEVSILAFVGGIFATQYDSDQTAPFLNQIADIHGAEICSRAVRSLSNLPIG